MSILRYKNSNGQWTELPLLEGPPGMSAYEHAVAGGYDGTLEEFEEQLNAVVNIDEAEELGIDGNPIENSNNLITSGGVYSALNDKVDKVFGKGLSTNDYDTTAKAKVDAIPSTPKYTDTIYDDTAIKSRVSTIENKEAGWDAKQDAISDLTTIRSGASKGATAMQENDVYEYLSDHNYMTSGSVYGMIENAVSTKQDTISDLATIRSGAALGATAVQPEAGKGLFSGNYNDLTNKPTIPSAVTESTVSGWGFTKNTGTYSKPSTGIPKTDLASAVQTSLSKADTALQSVPSEYVTETELNNHHDSTKQDVLTAGENISIVNNVISASVGSDPILDNAKATGGIGWTEQGEQITITWDGDTEGRVNFDVSSLKEYLVSNTFVTIDELDGATITFQGSTAQISRNNITTVEDNLVYSIGGGLIISAKAGVYDDFVVPTDGIYFAKSRTGSYATSLTYDSETVHKINSKYVDIGNYATKDYVNNHHDDTKQDKSTLEQDVADKGFTKIEYVNITGTSGNLDAETYAILSDTTKEVVVVYNNNYLKRIQVKSEYVRFSMTRNRNVTPGQNETITLIAYNGAPNYSYNFKYEIIDQTYYVIMTTDPELSFAENNLGLNLSAIDMSQLDNSKSKFITLADLPIYNGGVS